MQDRPVEITETLVTKWRALGYVLGLWPYRTDAMPLLIAWKPENETRAVVTGVQVWHLGNYQRPVWMLGPCFQSRIPKSEIREFSLMVYNQLVGIEQDRYDLLMEGRKRTGWLAPRFSAGEERQPAVRLVGS